MRVIESSVVMIFFKGNKLWYERIPVGYCYSGVKPKKINQSLNYVEGGILV